MEILKQHIKCPTCQGPLKTKVIACEQCNLKIEGDFVENGEVSNIPKIQWVPQKTAHNIKLLIPNQLFIGDEFNENSLEELEVYTEPHYLELKEGEEIQFVRFGYCRKDSQNQAIFTHK